MRDYTTEPSVYDNERSSLVHQFEGVASRSINMFCFFIIKEKKELGSCTSDPAALTT